MAALNGGDGFRGVAARVLHDKVTAAAGTPPHWTRSADMINGGAWRQLVSPGVRSKGEYCYPLACYCRAVPILTQFADFLYPVEFRKWPKRTSGRCAAVLPLMAAEQREDFHS